MELAYTIIFFIFVYQWFSRYNFISLILFVWTFNSLRNIRNHIVKKNISDSPNPFIRGIKAANDWVSWAWVKLTQSSTKSSFWLFQWLGDKYSYLNTNFLELVEITKQESFDQFSSGFNYTLNTVLMPPATCTKQISSKSSTQTSKDMVDLNNEYRKKNSIFIPFSLLLGGLSTKSKSNMVSLAEQTIKTQEEINQINTIIKDLETKNTRINLYDSDDEGERDDSNERIDSNDDSKQKIE